MLYLMIFNQSLFENFSLHKYPLYEKKHVELSIIDSVFK